MMTVPMPVEIDIEYALTTAMIKYSYSEFAVSIASVVEKSDEPLELANEIFKELKKMKALHGGFDYD